MGMVNELPMRPGFFPLSGQIQARIYRASVNFSMKGYQ